MAASLTTAGADAAALKVPTPAAGGAGHQQPGGGHDSDGPDLTADNMVEFSSRLIAAARAGESRRADRLFHDPFAELLAGPDVMRVYNEGEKRRGEVASAPPDATGSTSSAIAAAGDDLRSVGNITMLTPKRPAIPTRFCGDFYADCTGTTGIKQAGPDVRRLYNEGEKARDEASSAPPDATDSTSSAIAATGGAAKSMGEIGKLVPRRLAIRTRFCDDFFEDCAGPRGIKQIVLLGAGMDTRGLRLKTAPGTKVFEVDLPLVLRVKSALLSKAPAAEGSKERDGGVGQAQVVPVEADLSEAGWEGELFEAGFDPNQPSAWILEGLTMYLDEQELLRLLRTISKHCSPNSAFCATSLSEDIVAVGKASGIGLFATWKWGCNEPQAFYKANFPSGWVFKGAPCGTPGIYPDGAEYGVGFRGMAPTYVVGFVSAALERGGNA